MGSTSGHHSRLSSKATRVSNTKLPPGASAPNAMGFCQSGLCCWYQREPGHFYLPLPTCASSHCQASHTWAANSTSTCTRHWLCARGTGIQDEGGHGAGNVRELEVWRRQPWAKRQQLQSGQGFKRRLPPVHGKWNENIWVQTVSEICA